MARLGSAVRCRSENESWKRFVRDEQAHEDGDNSLFFILWALAHALDCCEKAEAKVELPKAVREGIARVYSVMVAGDQVLTDLGDWRRAYPLLHIADPPAHARRQRVRAIRSQQQRRAARRGVAVQRGQQRAHIPPIIGWIAHLLAPTGRWWRERPWPVLCTCQEIKTHVLRRHKIFRTVRR